MQSVLCPLSRACGTFVVVWHWSVHQCAAAIDRFTCERVLSACARLDQISCSACSRLWRADRSPIGIPEICGLDCTRSNAHDQNVLACGQFDHDRCALRVASKSSDTPDQEALTGKWIVHQWIKKAILLSFVIEENTRMEAGGYTSFYDKAASKFADYTAGDFAAGGFRVVPPA